MTAGVAWMTRSARRSSSGRPTLTTVGAKATTRHAGGHGPVHDDDLGGTRLCQGEHRRPPAPPAPITPQRRPAGSKPRPAEVVQQAVAVIALGRDRPLVKTERVRRPESPHLSGMASRHTGGGVLVGHRHRQAAKPRAAAPATARSSDPGGTSKAR